MCLATPGRCGDIALPSCQADVSLSVSRWTLERLQNGTMHIVFLAWRDLANPLAGGSEILVDRLATGLVSRGHRVTLIAGGPTAERPYEVIDAGSVFGQYAKAPAIALGRFRSADLVIDVCNGMPYFSPLWRRKPTLCLVNHVHTEQWELWFSRHLAAVGRSIERDVMPLVYRNRLFMAVSPSTAAALEAIGVPSNNIRIVPNGVTLPAAAPAAKSDEPLFFALGRLVPHKRYDLLLDLWQRVRPETGGTLVIAGEGPDADRLAATAVPGVVLTGRIDEAEKTRLLAQAWLFLHPAMLEGWGLVVMEAAAHGTPTLGFDAPGVRDSVDDGVSGVLARDHDDMVAQWIRLTRDRAARTELGVGARARAAAFSWDTTVDRFETVAREAVGAHRAWARPRAAAAVSPLRAVSDASPELSIVVPAFNEATRLVRSLPKLVERTHGGGVELIVVDDGSTDGTTEEARRLLEGVRDADVITLPVNRGKGAAVRAGVARATGRTIVFMDADLATDLDDLRSLEQALHTAHVAIGSRATAGSVTVGGTPSRAVMGRTFNRLARTVTRLDVRDFQCGFKAFRAPAAKLLFHLSEIEGYAFDVELLALARRIGYHTVELPVQWRAVPGSHVRPILDSFQMARDVMSLPHRWSSRRLTAAVEAYSRRESDPRQVVASLDPLLGSLGPVVPWQHGALALLPFKDEGDAEELRDELRQQLPELRLEVAAVSSSELLDPAGRQLRSALAAG